MAWAQSDDESSRQTSCKRQTGKYVPWRLSLSDIFRKSAAVQFLHLPVWIIVGVNEMTASFVHFLRSNERGLTQRAFLLPLTIAPQRIYHPAPPPPYCNSFSFSTHETFLFHIRSTLTDKCSVYRQSQQIRNIAEELDPTFQARRQGTESQRVEPSGTVNRKSDRQYETAKTIAEHSTSLFPPTQVQHLSHILAYMTSSRNQLSSHPQNARLTNQGAWNPKRRRKIANNSKLPDSLCCLSAYLYILKHYQLS